MNIFFGLDSALKCLLRGFVAEEGDSLLNNPTVQLYPC